MDKLFSIVLMMLCVGVTLHAGKMGQRNDATLAHCGQCEMNTSEHHEEIQLEGAALGRPTMDYDAAIKLAKEKKLPILLDFTGSDWCGWCKLMVKNVFSKKEWKAYVAKHLITVVIDFPKDPKKVPEAYKKRNEALQKTFKVTGYPTYILLASDGKTVLGRLGAGRDKTAESFQKEVDQILTQSSIHRKISYSQRMIAKYQKLIAKHQAVIKTEQAKLQATKKVSPPPPLLSILLATT